MSSGINLFTDLLYVYNMYTHSSLHLVEHVSDYTLFTLC